MPEKKGKRSPDPELSKDRATAAGVGAGVGGFLGLVIGAHLARSCPKCSTSVGSDAHYCPKCGFRF
ncbi:MAG TPA: zinc-ribbon domain-containing protein [Thermoplasmata archaeon]|nr:zinc-ribbon domain-containing protein [Thermoplasmata archaeon]